MAAPTRLGYVTATSSGTVPATVDLSAIPDGSWMVALLTLGSSVATGAAPTGWTMFCVDQIHGSRTFRYGGKIKAAGDTISWNSASSAYKRLTVIWGAGAAPVAEWLHGLIGVRNASNVVGGQSVQAGTSTTSIAPTVTPAKLESLVLALFSESTSATGAATTSGGFTFWFNVGDEATVIEQHTASYLASSDTSPTAAQTATYTQVQASNGLGVQLVIPPAASGPDYGPGLDAYNGEKKPVKVYAKTNSGIKTPQSLSYLAKGYDSVAHMMSGEFYWAHRGGSASYPEHSLWAYTQSAIRGYGVLEVSLARTSDGVWFGLHDDNINRTSGTTGLPAASSMTWAQINSYQITIGASGAPKPYMKWTDLVAAYGSTHIIIADPKYASAFINEYWTMMQALGNRAICKNFYDAGWFRDAAAARGLATWGYAYEVNLTDPQINSRLAGWTLLGLEYSASQAAWNQVLAINPNVVAHICATEANVSTGRSRGAKGFQCSGTGVIKPAWITH